MASYSSCSVGEGLLVQGVAVARLGVLLLAVLQGPQHSRKFVQSVANVGYGDLGTVCSTSSRPGSGVPQ